MEDFKIQLMGEIEAKISSDPHDIQPGIEVHYFLRIIMVLKRNPLTSMPLRL